MLARRWLLEPHVRRWWHDDPTEHDYPEGTLREWRLAIRGEDPTDMFVIGLAGRPIGMLQAYRVQDYPEYVEEIGEVDEAAMSIDLFIGEADLIGEGHGPALIREFMRPAFERYGVSYCVIGPSRANVYREPDTIDPEHVLLDIRRSDLG